VATCVHSAALLLTKQLVLSCGFESRFGAWLNEKRRSAPA
jgi:hypothetical protein